MTAKDRRQFILLQNFHLIGIGGDGMSALGGLLLDLGKNISGSEQNDLKRVKQKTILEDFSNRGCAISFGHKAENLVPETEAIIRSSIIPETNPEIIEARRRNLPILKRSEALGELMKKKVGISVAGCAGKSSTTAMIGFSLDCLGADPTIYLGARMRNYDNKNYHLGKGSYFVAEADEFDRSFLDLNRRYAIMTNIFFADHVDYYRDIVETKSAFTQFLKQSSRAFVNGDDHQTIEVALESRAPFETFGLGQDNDWRAVNLLPSPQGTFYDVLHGGKVVAHGQVSIPGIHSVLNALVAVVVISSLGFRAQDIVDSLSGFSGIRRRLEKRGVVNGVSLFDDYGHNRVQIDAAINGLRQLYPTERIFAVFQPRQYKRTRQTLGEIIQSFKGIEMISVLDISYGIGDTKEDEKLIHSKDLVKAFNDCGKKSAYNGTFSETVSWLKSVTRPGDVVITFGTGDPYRVTDRLLSDQAIS